MVKKQQMKDNWSRDNIFKSDDFVKHLDQMSEHIVDAKRVEYPVEFTDNEGVFHETPDLKFVMRRYRIGREWSYHFFVQSEPDVLTNINHTFRTTGYPPYYTRTYVGTTIHIDVFEDFPELKDAFEQGTQFDIDPRYRLDQKVQVGQDDQGEPIYARYITTGLLDTSFKLTDTGLDINLPTITYSRWPPYIGTSRLHPFMIQLGEQGDVSGDMFLNTNFVIRTEHDEEE